MRITSAEFVTSAGRMEECPPEARVEIAMSGRSNVGKSSLLNSLFRRKNLVKVSGTPGKTQRLNFFLVNGEFHLVDLPGYGFARASGRARNEWSGMMQSYLQTRRQLAAVIQLVDCRHEPSREDREMVQWLVDERMPFCLVATKIDKLGATKVEPAIRGILRELELPAGQVVLGYSSHTDQGRVELLEWIGEAVKTATAG